MRRFIRYLYEYEQGKKVRNVGFVNVEQDASESTVHIHGKGLRLSGGDELKLYLFWEKDGRNIGVYQGDVAFMGPAVNYRLKYTPEDTGSTENYDSVGGIILKDRNGRTFAAVWEEEPVDAEKIPCGTMQEVSGEEKSAVTRTVSEKEEGQTEPAEVQPEKTDNGTGSGRNPDSAEPEKVDDGTGFGRNPDSAEPEKMNDGTESGRNPDGAEPEKVNDGTESGRNPDGAEPERMNRVMQPSGTDGEQENAEMSVQEAYEDMCQWKVAKLKRNEISRLPRCEWRLANNNFLLHGYYNYHHLVLLDDGSVLRLGVPGIYHAKEARAAAGFGFPEFIGADEIKIVLDDEECSDEENFGYWCRQVRRPVR